MLIGGGVLLVVGAEGLVRGASRLAASMGIPPIIIGLTVVALGTSSPELAVGISSSLGGNADIAMGNVVGSNIFNVLFILGVTAIISPLVVHERIIFFEVPLMIFVSLLLLVFSIGGNLNRIEGIILIVGLIAYMLFLIRQSRRENAAVTAEYAAEFSEADKTPSTIARDVIFVLVGLGLLVTGSELFVGGATEIAEALGVSQLVIGLTIVAIGTSLPEVATSILASLKGERDIAVGNVVGSNIFNILAVLGISSAVSGSGIAAADVAVRFDIPIMTGVAVITAPIIFSRREVSRWEGVLFVGYYFAYTAYLILDASGNSHAGNFRVAMLGVVVPVTCLVVLLVAGKEFLHLRKNGGIRGPQSAA